MPLPHLERRQTFQFSNGTQKRKYQKHVERGRAGTGVLLALSYLLLARLLLVSDFFLFCLLYQFGGDGVRGYSSAVNSCKNNLINGYKGLYEGHASTLLLLTSPPSGTWPPAQIVLIMFNCDFYMRSLYFFLSAHGFPVALPPLFANFGHLV